MILGKYIKQPAEVSDYDISHADWLRADETLSTATATVTCLTSTDSSLVVGSATISAQLVRVRLSGGLAGEEYKVTALVTSSSGRVAESEFKVKVKEY